jgi:endogenous inhibitor of DNA gyrase (YacG/DUF329 family)
LLNYGMNIVRTAVCPICGIAFRADACTSIPFCSDRCRHVDLGRWLNEGYSLPVEPEEGEGGGELSGETDA